MMHKEQNYAAVSVAFICRLLACSTVAFSLAGCETPWPQNMPPIRYAGTVINSTLSGRLEPSAVLKAERPAARGMSLEGVPNHSMVEATSDAQGHFVLQTQSGYATEIDAVSADERLRGTVSVPSRSTEGIVVAVKPVLQATLFNGEFDPKTVRGRQVGFAVEHLINYLSAHPREPLHSLRTYTERNVISSEQLAYFTQSPNLFLSSNAQVNYVWGKQALIFSSVEAPISFGVTPLMQRAGFSPSSR